MDKNKYQIIYKLHPAEIEGWKNEYPYLSNCDIQVIDTNRIHLYELFSQCTYQIGVYSTALFEGIGFGLLTFILKHRRSETMYLLWEKGLAQLVENENEIFEIICKDIENNITLKLINKLWKNNSINNMKKEIDKELLYYRTQH